VLRPHAQEVLLSRAQSLQRRIGECIRDHLGRQLDVALDDGRGEQRADRLDEDVVEAALRLAEPAIGLLAQGLEPPVDLDRALRVERGQHVGDQLVPLVALRVDVQANLAAHDAKLRRGSEEQQVRPRALAAGDVVDRGHEALDQPVRGQPDGEPRVGRQPARELPHQRVALGERRQRPLLGRLGLGTGRERLGDRGRGRGWRRSGFRNRGRAWRHRQSDEGWSLKQHVGAERQRDERERGSERGAGPPPSPRAVHEVHADTLPPDRGVVAAFIGSRGAAARQQTSSTLAIAGLFGPYGAQFSYYQSKFPGQPAVRVLVLALTDTFYRAFYETFRDLAVTYGVHLAASVNAAPARRVDEADDPGRVALLRDPDEPKRTYAYEAVSPL